MSKMQSSSRCRDHPTPEMIRAFEQFNRGEYFEQHETLETIWRAETDESIRNFYKGILQIGVGFHHLTRRNYDGSIKVLARGIDYLKPFMPQCMGVDVQQLIDEATQVLERERELGAERINELDITTLPRIHY